LRKEPVATAGGRLFIEPFPKHKNSVPQSGTPFKVFEDSKETFSKKFL
jgi:hypothetical protein